MSRGSILDSGSFALGFYWFDLCGMDVLHGKGLDYAPPPNKFGVQISFPHR